MCAFLRAAPKRQAEDKGGEEKRSQNRGEKGRRSNAKNTLENDKKFSHFGSKIVQKPVREELAARTWLQERLGRLLGSLLEPFWDDLGSFWETKSEQKTHQHLEAILEGPTGRQGRRANRSDSYSRAPGRGRGGVVTLSKRILLGGLAP